MTIQVSAGIALALMLGAVVAVSAVQPSKQLSVGPLALFSTSIPYVVVASAWMALGGVSLFYVLLLVALAVVPMLLHALVGTDDAKMNDSGTGRRWAGLLAGIGLVTLLLIAAGQTLALLGRVNMIAAIVSVGVAGALIGIAGGLRGSARVGAWMFWIMTAATLVVLTLGLFLGRLSYLGAPVLASPGVPSGGLLCLVLAVIVIGWADPATRVFVRAASKRALTAGVVVTAVLVLVFFGALTLFYGGSFYSPSLQFFVIPANLDLVPGGLPVVMGIVALLFAAAIGNLVASMSSGPLPDHISIGFGVWVTLLSIVTAALAPGSEHVAVVTALLAAGFSGPALRRTDGLGRSGALCLGAAVVGATVLLATDSLDFGWPALVAIGVVLAISLTTSLMSSRSGRAASERIGADSP